MTTAQLPNDIDALKSLIIEQHEKLQARDAQLLAQEQELTTRDEQLSEREARIADLESQIACLQRSAYGRSSEKLDPKQLLLFKELQKQLEKARQEEGETQTETITYTRRKGHGRKPIPDHLPRQREEHLPEHTDCPCCGEAMKRIGEEVTEELDYNPGSLFVREHVRPKYACRHCENGVHIADLPPRPIEKGIPGPGLLAHVLTSKYADHQPLNRLAGILRRHGTDLRVSTMCDWIGRMADLLSPIYDRLRAELLSGDLISADETTVPYQVDHVKKGTATGYLWTYLSERRRLVLYDFTTSRSRAGPKAFLRGFEGYLVTDGYEGYKAFVRESGSVSCGCWSHARRKFYDARKDDPRHCRPMLTLIGAMFQVEREALEASLKDDAYLALRHEKSAPLLKQIREHLDASGGILPQSSVSKAFTYLANQWSPLTRFQGAAIIPIHNNASERAMRHVVIGRKNWLFAGSVSGGHRAAKIYSIIATCKANGLDPFAYLRDVIDRLPRGEDPDGLLPSAWKTAQLQIADTSA